MRDLLPPLPPSAAPPRWLTLVALLAGLAAAAAWAVVVRYIGAPLNTWDLVAVGAAVMLAVEVVPMLRRQRAERRDVPPVLPGAPLYGPSWFDKTYAWMPTRFFAASAVFCGVSVVVALVTLYLGACLGQWNDLPVVLMGLAIFGVLGGLSVYGLLRRLRQR